MLQGGPTLPAHLVAAVCAAAELRRPPLEGKSLAVADAAPLHDSSHLPARMPAAGCFAKFPSLAHPKSAGIFPAHAAPPKVCQKICQSQLDRVPSS